MATTFDNTVTSIIKGSACGLALLASLGSTSAQAALALGTNGSTLNLLDVSAAGISIVDSASIPGDEVFTIHTLFDIQFHPVTNIAYVSSFNPCNDGDIGCWGNARIDKFGISGTSLTYLGPAYIFDDVSFALDGGPPCSVDDFGYAGQIGACAPSDFTFSADGTRLYIDDDSEDAVVIMSVNPDGNLSFITVGGSTGAHGFAINGDYLYHSATIFDISGDTVTTVSNGPRGTEQLILSDGSLMAIASNNLQVFDISTPTTAVSVANLSVGFNAIDFSTIDETLIAVSGREGLATVSWDGTNLTLLDAVSLPGVNATNNVRGVQVFAEGGVNYALVATFEAGSDATYDTNGATFTVFSIAGDGTLAEIDSLPVSGQARSVSLAGPSVFGELVPVPFLPLWALALLGGALGLIAVRGIRRKASV